MKTEERRFVEAECRIEPTENGPGKIVGYAAVFGRSSVDMYGMTEEVAPNAFTDTLKEADVRALVDHDWGRIIGRSSAGTLRLSEDDHGLRMEIDLPDTTVGRDIAKSVERGDVTGASFGFRTIADSWRTVNGKPHRTLEAVDLRDVGPVTFPAYPDTEVALRSLEEWRKDETPEEPTPEENHQEEKPEQDLSMLEARQRQAEAECL